MGAGHAGGTAASGGVAMTSMHIHALGWLMLAVAAAAGIWWLL